MNYWLGRASYFEQIAEISADNYTDTTTIVTPKRNIAYVVVSFDKENI